FHNDGIPEYFLASADWMERNLDRRVEMAFPILDPQLQIQLRDFLEVQLVDNVKGRLLQPDGTSRRLCPGDGQAVRSQERLYELIGALSSGVQSVLTE
ncbi:MAG TPA: RNA degradosome polyphosphate kinase, partial [Candidatus Methylomirabilis sp.]